MSDPNHPDAPSRSPIADAASLFDSNVVHAFNPPPDPDPPSPALQAADDEPASGYGIDLAQTAPKAATPRVAPPRANPRPVPKSPATPSSRNFDPSDDDDEPVAKSKSSPSSRSDSAVRVERKSDHIDAESDSSDRVPSRSKRRSSDRAIGFDEADDDDAILAEDDPGEVDPIWTRGAEWGFDLVRVGLVAVATLFGAYFAFGWSFGLAVLVLGLGGAAGVLLSYPILITIERPIRITPEQAVTDFFAAAAHHLPHYRRMWLLLSPTARSAGRFSSLDEFRSHWVRRMATWKEGRGGKFTPLSFRISEFRGDKSVGQTTSHVDYTVQVFVRGREADKPIATYRMMHGVVKGPDRMWYLNQGTLASAGR